MEKKFRNNSEYFFIEINLRKKKWRLCCSYNPNKNSILAYRELDLHSSNYENFILLRNLNILQYFKFKYFKFQIYNNLKFTIFLQFISPQSFNKETYMF